MIRYFTVCVLMLALIALPASGQEQKPSSTVDTLKLQLVVSRFDGDKRLSSVPLLVSVVTTGQPSQVSMGTEVPVPNTIPTPPSGGTPITSFNYKSVGTSVTAFATRLSEGRYQVFVGVEANWVGQAVNKELPGLPQFGTFKAEQRLVAADGGSSQFTSAADAATGQMMKVDLTVTKQQ